MVISYVVWDSVAQSQHLLETSGQYGVAVDAPAIDPHSATGYELGRRSLLLPAGEADTAHWIMQTQSMIDRGEWRIRHVDYDNAPRGREVHWAMPFHAWLAGLAWIDRIVSDRPAGIAVERATLLSGPVMLALLLLGLMPFLSRKFSTIAAVLVAIGTVTTFTFYLDFMPARADHHGLANICGLFVVLCLAAGSSFAPRLGANQTSGAEDEIRSARWWFAASGLAGGLGLWVSAATTVPLLVGVGLGLLSGGWIARRAPGSLTWMRVPGLWRTWGWVGGGTSLVAYTIEYFPNSAGMRLEVNHPLYAAAWVGAGELLRAAVIAMNAGTKTLSRRDLSTATVAAGLVTLLPLAIFFTGEKTFTVSDPFIWQLHSRYISEFQSLGRNFAEKGIHWATLDLCGPMLFLIPPIVLLFRSGPSRAVKAELLLVAVPAWLAWAMGWNQVRWLSLAYAMSVPGLALFFRALEAESGDARRRQVVAWAAACGLLMLPGAMSAVQRTLTSAESTATEIRRLAERDVAHWLRLRGGPDRTVVAAAPMPTTRLISEGGMAGLGTLYWENAEGLKNTAALFAASSPETARAMVQRLGVTHIVLFSWDAFEITLAKLYRGLPESAPIPPDLFIANLLASPLPPAWLRPVPFKLPNHPSLTGAQVRIWEITPDQSPAEVAAHAANYYLELGTPGVSATFAPLLEGFGNDLAATVMRAALAARERDGARFSAALQPVMALLPRAGALAPEDHVHLVTVLAIAQQADRAREQLQACMRKIDERNLRHFSTGALTDLLELSAALQVPLPSPALQRLAEKLVPPARRK